MLKRDSERYEYQLCIMRHKTSLNVLGRIYKVRPFISKIFLFPVMWIFIRVLS